MKKNGKRLLNGSVWSVMFLALVVLSITVADACAGIQESDLKDTTVETGDGSDMGAFAEVDEICVAVTGITGGDIEFIMVPANVPGPGEKGFDLNASFDKMVGGGELFKGEVFACYFGTEAQLTDPGVKIYSFKYDESVAATSVPFEDFIKSVKLSLVPNTTVKKVELLPTSPVPGKKGFPKPHSTTIVSVVESSTTGRFFQTTTAPRTSLKNRALKSINTNMMKTPQPGKWRQKNCWTM